MLRPLFPETYYHSLPWIWYLGCHVNFGIICHLEGWKKKNITLNLEKPGSFKFNNYFFSLFLPVLILIISHKKQPGGNFNLFAWESSYSGVWQLVLAVCWNLSWGFWLEHVASPCDLGLLSVWQLGSKSKYPKKDQVEAASPYITWPQHYIASLPLQSQATQIQGLRT